jgi:hypothetical protein
MIYVGLLTENEKDQILGQQYSPDSYFNPIQDIDDNWIISTEEINYCVNPEFEWIKTIPLIEYKPKPTPTPKIID